MLANLIDLVLPKNKNFSFETLVLIGELSSFQFGNSSSNALCFKNIPT